MESLPSGTERLTDLGQPYTQKLRPPHCPLSYRRLSPLSLLPLSLILVALMRFATPLEFPYSPQNTTVESTISLLEHGDTTREVSLIVLAVLSILVLSRTAPVRLQKLNTLGLALILFMGMSCISILWADDTFLACKHVLVLLILGLTAVALSVVLSYYQLLVCTAFGCFIVITLGVLTYIATKSFSPWNPDYRLSGVLHPNAIGQHCAVLILALFCLSRGKPPPRRPVSKQRSCCFVSLFNWIADVISECDRRGCSLYCSCSFEKGYRTYISGRCCRCAFVVPFLKPSGSPA